MLMDLRNDTQRHARDVRRRRSMSHLMPSEWPVYVRFTLRSSLYTPQILHLPSNDPDNNKCPTHGINPLLRRWQARSIHTCAWKPFNALNAFGVSSVFLNAFLGNENIVWILIGIFFCFHTYTPMRVGAGGGSAKGVYLEEQ